MVDQNKLSGSKILAEAFAEYDKNNKTVIKPDPDPVQHYPVKPDYVHMEPDLVIVKPDPDSMPDFVSVSLVSVEQVLPLELCPFHTKSVLKEPNPLPMEQDPVPLDRDNVELNPLPVEPDDTPLKPGPLIVEPDPNPVEHNNQESNQGIHMEPSADNMPPQSVKSASRSNLQSKGQMLGMEHQINLPVKESSVDVPNRSSCSSDKENIKDYNPGQPDYRSFGSGLNVVCSDCPRPLQSATVKSVQAELCDKDIELPLCLSCEDEKDGKLPQEEDCRKEMYESNSTRVQGESDKGHVDKRGQKMEESYVAVIHPSKSKGSKRKAKLGKKVGELHKDNIGTSEEEKEESNVAGIHPSKNKGSKSKAKLGEKRKHEDEDPSFKVSESDNGSAEETHEFTSESWTSKDQSRYGLRKRKRSVISKLQEMDEAFSDDTESAEESKPLKSKKPKESEDEDFIPDFEEGTFEEEEEEGEKFAPMGEEEESEARKEFMEIGTFEKNCVCKWVQKEGGSESEQAKVIQNNTECKNSNIKALASLPDELCLGLSSLKQGMGVFCMVPLAKGTQLGPLEGEGRTYEEMNKEQDLTNVWIVPIHKKEEENPEDKNYVCMDSEMNSNWCRYLQASTNVNQCNLEYFLDENKQIIFKTFKLVKPGEELICHLNRRSESAKENSSLTCCDCNIKFDSDILFTKHKLIFHTFGFGKFKSQCSLCKKIFPSSAKLREHCLSEHDGSGAYRCKECGKEFLKKKFLELHVKRMHEEVTEKFTCDFCGKAFIYKSELGRHRTSHDSPTHKCQTCGRMFKSNLILRRHQNVHNPDKKYTCQFCGKGFISSNILKVHLLTHSKQRPFQCTESGCDAAYTTKQQLQFHYKKTHNYTAESMPEITRSLPYTMEAYAERADDSSLDSQTNASTEETKSSSSQLGT